MFKTKNEIIIIKAEATAPVNTGVVFWSHDRGTAKFIFQLTKDGVNQSLATGTLVPICLDFVIGDVKGKHIYHAVIEDAVNGIVSFVLQDQILWFQGEVTGSIYIELPDTRSLDSAGRFTFNIQRSPIDMTTPPEQHFYWDGFNEIMQEYDKTIAYIKSESKKLLDNLTTNVTNAQTKVDKLEKDIETANTTLNNRIDEIHKKIDDEDVYRKNDVFTKEESSANVINQVIGTETVRIDFKMDFKDTENVGKLFGSQFGSLIPPTHSEWGEASQSMQDDIGILDGKYVHHSTYTNKYLALGKIEWNILDFLKEKLGESFFTDQGAVNTVEQVEIIKQKITNDRGTVWGFGSGVEGNKLTFAVWNTRLLNWSGTRSNGTGEVSGITIPINNAKEYINNDGICTFVAYGNPSNISTPSTINLDYANFQFTLELSANEFIKSMIAANHVENIATKEEAEAGEDNTKIMTPLRTSEEIDRKTVSIAGNQTIGGIKNFKDGLLFDSLPVQAGMIEREITLADRSDTTNVTDVNGTITRIGNLVFLAFNFNCTVWPTNTDTRLILKVPDGYKRENLKPENIALQLARNADQPASARAYVDNKNIVQVKSGNGSSYVSGMWTTKDEWPE